MSPTDIRDHPGLQPGDRLDFIMQDDGVILLRPVMQDGKCAAGRRRSLRGKGDLREVASAYQVRFD